MVKRQFTSYSGDIYETWEEGERTIYRRVQKKREPDWSPPAEPETMHEELTRLRAEVSALTSRLAAAEGECVWTQHENHWDGNEVWEPLCPDKVHYFFVGPASFYNFKVCPYCGKKLVVK